ncbi:U-box domain [Dillenia turbinata]|uniref:RING-type E3 ubiquitin transferase n=1 Tax=Dillenia turbinata TaxID=194707 RepID=A0AAN8UXR9_9MAGN
MAGDDPGLIEDLDDTTGRLATDMAEELEAIAMECLSTSHESNARMRLGTIMRELSEVRKKADELAANEGREVVTEGGVDMHIEDSFEIPKVFFCPILRAGRISTYGRVYIHDLNFMVLPIQNIIHMLRADGFSYELEAIEEWLGMAHDTSPMTNLRLKHKHLTPNHTLRTPIRRTMKRLPFNIIGNKTTQKDTLSNIVMDKFSGRLERLFRSRSKDLVAYMAKALTMVNGSNNEEWCRWKIRSQKNQRQ